MDGALIYPYLNLTESAPIKELLFLYDNLYRIVPKDAIPEDDPEIKSFNNEYGIIKNISPDRYLETVYENFKQKIDDGSWLAAGLDYDIEDASYSRLHKGKVYDELRKIIEREGFLTDKEEWYIGPSSFIGSYMTYLSLEISNRNNLYLETYRPSAWICQEFLNCDGKLNTIETEADEISHGLVNIYLKDFIPYNIDQISFDSIVEFRDEYREERRNFVKKIAEFHNELSEITDETVFDDTLKDQLQNLRDGIKNYREATSFFWYQRLAGLRVVAVPMIKPVAEQFISLDKGISKILTGLGLVATAYWQLVSFKKGKKQIRKSNPYSYLSFFDEFPFDEIPYINQSMISSTNEFIYD